MSSRTRSGRFATLAQAATLMAGLLLGTASCLAVDLGHESGRDIDGSAARSVSYKPGRLLSREDFDRSQAYARTVWMPQATSTKFSGQRISLGLARLNRVVLRGLRENDPSAGSSVVPVLSMPAFRDASITLIPPFGGMPKTMLALQMKL